jgi:hypothetical protein
MSCNLAHRNNFHEVTCYGLRIKSTVRSARRRTIRARIGSSIRSWALIGDFSPFSVRRPGRRCACLIRRQYGVPARAGRQLRCYIGCQLRPHRGAPRTGIRGIIRLGSSITRNEGIQIALGYSNQNITCKIYSYGLITCTSNLSLSLDHKTSHACNAKGTTTLPNKFAKNHFRLRRFGYF